MNNILKPVAILIAFAIAMLYAVALDKYDAALFWLAVSAFLAWLNEE